MRKLAAAMAAGLGLLPGAAPAAADTPASGALYDDGPSGRYLVAGTWHTRPDPLGAGVAAGWQRSEDLTGWSETSVPDAANAGDLSPRSYLGGVQWYRKDFTAPRAPARTHWVLRFESVNYRATVWLNGRMLGRHTGGYIPFELDAPALRQRAENRLVVRVDSRRGELDVPGLAQRPDGRFVGGWWNYTGILREVYLRRVDRLDLTNVVVRPRLPCRACAATLAIEGSLTNVGRRDATATVQARVGDRTVDFLPAIVPAGATRRLRKTVRMEEPRLWSPEDPHLYQVRLAVHDGRGARVQTYDVHTGIRAFTVRRGRLYINYRPARLLGANMHEDSPERGAALRASDLRANFDLLRELGATMTRAHYPLHPLTLELADRAGIVVWSEIPVYQMQDSLFRNARVRRQALYLLREMIKRDRNHASVMVWSVGNENTTRPGPGFTRYVRAAKRTARRLDRSRLVGLAIFGYPTVGRQALYSSLDALGINDYFGWYPGPEGSIAQREALGPYLDSLNEHYPRQALFVTEFGAEANRPGSATQKGTFEFQRDFVAYHLGVLESKPFVNGALVWLLRDFRVKPGFDGGNPQPQPPMNFKGLVDDSGRRKPAFGVVQENLRTLREQAAGSVR